MSQISVYELLKGNPDKKYSTKDLSRLLGMSQTSASCNIKRLMKRDEVGRIDVVLDVKYRSIPHYFWFDKKERFI